MVKVYEFEIKEDLYYWCRGRTWAEIEGSDRVSLDDVAIKVVDQIVFIKAKAREIQS